MTVERERQLGIAPKSAPEEPQEQKSKATSQKATKAKSSVTQEEE
jgi:hypothetical protein